MEFRTRGIVIALASSAAGGLLPAAVLEQMSGNYLMAAGLGAVVLLNAAIAFIHIKEPARSGRAHDEGSKTDGQKTAPYALRAVKPSEPA